MRCMAVGRVGFIGGVLARRRHGRQLTGLGVAASCYIGSRHTFLGVRPIADVAASIFPGVVVRRPPRHVLSGRYQPIVSTCKVRTLAAEGLFADAETGEDARQQVVVGYRAGDFTQRLLGQTQVLGGQFARAFRQPLHRAAEVFIGLPEG